MYENIAEAALAALLNPTGAHGATQSERLVEKNSKCLCPLFGGSFTLRKLRFLLATSIWRAPFGAMLRMSKIVPDDFVVLFRLAIIRLIDVLRYMQGPNSPADTLPYRLFVEAVA